ncbi:MAG: pyruvate kinase [Candidatus Paceibacterota bacterium]|jgi:pyruvate kinase
MISIKKTKIVATIGPATESAEMLEKLVDAGLNVMRLNFSHGDFVEHQKRVDNIKKVMKKTGKTVAILQDLSGPKIRIGEFYQDRVNLVAGEDFMLTTGDKIIGDEHKAWVNYPTLHEELKVGGFVLLDDGKKKLEVIDIKGNEIHCKIIVGGETKGRRGVNLPGAYLKISSITDKDRKDFEFGVKNKVDFIALSFVRRAEDVIELRGMLDKAKSKAMIISKIETEEAIENFDKILEVTDGIMVARGDLAIEIPAEKVPMLQKMMIEKCNEVGKPVITATQMLESMIKLPVPTRAEVSDVANAILDGTDGIMLSEETTLGSYPVESVKVMARVAHEIEESYPERYIGCTNPGCMTISDSITGSVVDTAHDIGAKVIIALTETGFTARMISRYKPEPIVLALSPNEKTIAQLSLSWGCLPMKIEKFKSLNDVFKVVRAYCLKNKLADKGDKVVIVAGAPFGTKGVETNMMVVEKI